MCVCGVSSNRGTLIEDLIEVSNGGVLLWGGVEKEMTNKDRPDTMKKIK